MRRPTEQSGHTLLGLLPGPAALVATLAVVLVLAVVASWPGSSPDAEPGSPAGSASGSSSGSASTGRRVADGPSGDALVDLRVRLLPLPPLTPGADYPLEVEVENTNARPVLMTEIALSVTRVDGRSGAGDGPCGVDDFRTRPGRFAAVEVPAGASLSLSEAGISRDEWPVVGMVDSETDQDGCQGSRLTLKARVHGTLQ